MIKVTKISLLVLLFAMARQRIKAVSYFSCEGKIIDPKQGEPQSEPIKNVGTGCKFGREKVSLGSMPRENVSTHPSLGPKMVGKKQQQNERAKEAVLEEWHRWKPDHPKEMMSGLMFYNYLSNEKSELLKFEIPGDKWQTVHGWLLRAGLVKN